MLNKLEDKEYKMQTIKLALFLGELLIKNGAETYRVEDSVLRICKSRGYNHINCFTTPTVIIISDDKFDGLCFMKTIDFRGMNLNKISLLNTFSREFVNKVDPDMDEEIQELHKIDKIKTYPPFFYFLGTGLGSACFAATLGGNQLNTFLLTVMTSIIATFVYDKTLKYSSIIVFSTILSSFIITSIGVLLHNFGIIPQPTALIVGSIMPLLPGVAFIKSMRDLISGNLMSGTARFFEVFVIVTGIASGVALVFGFGGV
ncbi:threonine/serine exporter family protein [Peptostreptococcus faecalis]|uniref:threonine/serine ThrE exporter family protein n=1 Tax=Peptostreptococcus faecalis TaxID=2045015 RepID=UPI000C7A6B4E|nr:threonine/serine exporter family protein [Peptostreptococcus faecalis]